MIDLPPRPGWMAHAVCRGADTDRIFYPARGESLAEARAFCARCPVREECLEYALANGDHFGIWGGSSDKQRRQMRRERKAS